jgi:sugar phosphate isomerase/epimerase
MNRRDFLACSLAGTPVLEGLARADKPPPTRLGIVAYSMAMRRSREAGLQDPVGFLEYCRSLGAGGIQVPLGRKDERYCARLRSRAEAAHMFIEGIIRLPHERNDVDRFEAEVRTARLCGAGILRTALLDGRRYEVFKTRDDFLRFDKQSRYTLTLARPIVEKHKVLLAIENHKDRSAAELAELLRWIRSASIGVCLDTGNNIALLEMPDETLEILSPFAFTTHVKDMAVGEYAGGFLLAEVPLGRGLLDLPRMFGILRKVRPGIHFNLEMITRDPLQIPCLTAGYWTTLPDMPASRLARMLTLVRSRKDVLPRISPLSRDDRLAREEANVRQSLRFARERLGL